MAQQSFKDPYLFDFLTLRNDHLEQDLEKGLIANHDQSSKETKPNNDIDEDGESDAMRCDALAIYSSICTCVRCDALR